MRISQLAERTGTPATTLRFYETAGLLSMSAARVCHHHLARSTSVVVVIRSGRRHGTSPGRRLCRGAGSRGPGWLGFPRCGAGTGARHQPGAGGLAVRDVPAGTCR
ncbi:MerR family DNA-binding transcriptional regulator [Saccharopolyspora elongata]|uniref:MerR family DNA-binding transcriptional regulator n=1 Tax=Saccharopolyspora elongata TaxID=2530387 RepID=UPI001F4355A3|nr:MerR family DNA-binding transcriptional regulator [Saccharopolyspora elongata]